MEPPDLLHDTNRRLHELERKLSFGLTSSLTHTEQSHGSVVHDTSVAGLARHNIQLSVLQYIRENGREFDADRVYADRQQQFITKFAREYSPNSVSDGTGPGNRETLPGTENTRDSELPPRPNKSSNGVSAVTTPLASPLGQSDTSDVLDLTARHLRSDGVNLYQQTARKMTVSLDVSRDLQEGGSLRASIEGDTDYLSDTYDDYYDGEFDSDDDDDFGNDFDDDFENDDDMLLPPLPPRLPPREMDPDKLYGLYDFSGPDPLHCTLSRDEPVYLINDLDNYWWLIRKMTKAERVELHFNRGSSENVVSEDEDGKVGFVPAECLETYGERLARLNCYKNEELEKTSVETLPMEYFRDGSAEFLEGSREAKEQPSEPKLKESLTQGEDDEIQREVSDGVINPMPEPVALGRKGSILKRPCRYRQSNKLVTFENLGDLNLDDDDGDDDMDFSDHYLHVAPGDIKDSHEQIEEPHSEDKVSEVLSDVYPAEMPLAVNKGIRRSELAPPQAISADTDSIGSFSPDTPPTNTFQSESFSTVRRSQILDRLLRMTSDIQEQFSDDPLFSHEYEDKYDQVYNPYHENGLNSKESFVGNGESSNDEIKIEDGKGTKEKTLQIEELDMRDGSKDGEIDGDKEPDFHFDYDTYQDYHDGSALESEDPKVNADTDTPLTSMNSLNTLALPTPPPDKRMSKPVHDMFMPILGKLDELTEKLAELEHHLR